MLVLVRRMVKEKEFGNENETLVSRMRAQKTLLNEWTCGSFTVVVREYFRGYSVHSIEANPTHWSNRLLTRTLR